MKDQYENPLCTRYASEKMQYIFSPDFKFSTWRRLWAILAESEMELGLPITQDQVDELKAHLTDIDYDLAADYEAKLRHDVMAHIRTYGDCCPNARPVIHLGATSCYVGDNTDVIQMREGLQLIRYELLAAIAALGRFAQQHQDTPTLAWTHYQAAQPTTLGKRACLWLQDLLLDLDRLDFELGRLKLLGCRGATGTAASFLELLGGDGAKVEALETRIAGKLGFDACMPVSGQTYTRKVDANILDVLSGIGQSASKFGNDIRLMAHMKEVDEPFEANQVGSSAMAYKRNPMRCERICSLSRYLISLPANTAGTAAAQWLERTLDDSANRRIVIAQGFLAADAILTLVRNVASGLVAYPKVMERHLNEELPMIATENILMHAVQQGGDRQTLHEVIRQYAQAAAVQVKQEGGDNDLLVKLLADERFHLTREALDEILDVRKFIGLAPQQTEAFLAREVQPRLAGWHGAPVTEVRV